MITWLECSTHLIGLLRLTLSVRIEADTFNVDLDRRRFRGNRSKFVSVKSCGQHLVLN